MATGNHYTIVRVVVSVLEADAVIVEKRAHGFSVSDNGTPEGMRWKHGSREELKYMVIRSVFTSGNLLYHYFTLRINSILQEERRCDHVSKNLKNAWKLVVYKTRVIAGIFLRRKGILLSTKRLKALRDGKGITLFGPLEHHMLNKMGYALLFVTLVARANLKPDTQTDGADGFHAFGYNRHAVT